MPLPLPAVTSSPLDSGSATSTAVGAGQTTGRRGVRKTRDAPVPDLPPRVGSPARVPAKGGARAGTFVQLCAADQGHAIKLGVDVVVALRRAFAAAALDPVDADRTLAILAADAEGQQRALAALFERKHNQVDASWCERLAEASAPAARVAWELSRWARRKAVGQACSGIHGSLVKLLREELDQTATAGLFWDAVDGIQVRKRQFAGSTGLGEYLAANGCLPPAGVWTLVPDFIPGSDPIALLAGHSPRLDAVAVSRRRDRPLFTAWRQRLLDAGLLDSEVWKSHMKSMYVARGVVGEWLRLLQLREQPEAAGKQIVQGALVLIAPDGLWACADAYAAKAWCEAHGHSTRGLYHVTSADGEHYGLLLTEVDVTALERRGEQLAITRLDNVKAGDGHGDEARHQNQVVREALEHPHLRFCLPNERGDAYADIASRLCRGAEDLAAIRYDTVGPEGADEYSVQMPLTEVELTNLTKDLLLLALGRG